MNLHEALSAATDAAHAACGVLLKHRATLLAKGSDAFNIRTKSHATDFFSIVDEEAQDAVIEVLRKRFPDFRILAEEEGADAYGDPSSPYRWVIDPLDGTNNFLHGNPAFGTIIGLERDGVPVAGVIALPVLGHVFAGGEGMGVTHNGVKLHGLRATPSLKEATISANIHLQKRPHGNGEMCVPVPPDAYVKNYGCAANEIADVLLQWADGVAFRGIGYWDVLAGCALIKELGGTIRLEPINPADHRKGVRCVASTKRIFSDLERFVFG